jgi:predicted molibdopterin-dependent oxidoreductase YjgC
MKMPDRRKAMAGDLRIGGGLRRGEPISIFVDERPVKVFEGESVAAALMAMGHRTSRFAWRTTTPRGYFCGMGICHDCLMVIDGIPNTRACMTPVRAGLRVETQRGVGEWESIP